MSSPKGKNFICIPFITSCTTAQLKHKHTIITIHSNCEPYNSCKLKVAAPYF